MKRFLEARKKYGLKATNAINSIIGDINTKGKSEDAVFIDQLNSNVKSLGTDLLNHVRYLNPNGVLILGKGKLKFINHFNKIYLKYSGNFIALQELKDGIKIYLWPGKYSFLDKVNITYDPRYPNFKIVDKYEIQSAKDAIELSLYYHLDWMKYIK